MDKDFEDFIAKRCEDELMKNNEYRFIQKQAIIAYKENDIEKYSEYNVILQSITLKISYSKGFSDYPLFIN